MVSSEGHIGAPACWHCQYKKLRQDYVCWFRIQSFTSIALVYVTLILRFACTEWSNFILEGSWGCNACTWSYDIKIDTSAWNKFSPGELLLSCGINDRCFQKVMYFIDVVVFCLPILIYNIWKVSADVSWEIMAARVNPLWCCYIQSFASYKWVSWAPWNIHPGYLMRYLQHLLKVGLLH